MWRELLISSITNGSGRFSLTGKISSISISANDEGYNQLQRRFLSILAKTLPPTTMGFGWRGTVTLWGCSR